MGFIAYLAVLAWAPRLGRGVIWGAIVTLLALFAALPPLLSHDVYSYVDFARLGVLHGLDPYVQPPASVPTDAVFADVAWTETTSAYGPLFTLATYPLAWLPVDAAVYTLKAASAAAVLGIAVLVARLAPARGLDPTRAAAFVALNPLVLVHVVGGPHNDSIAALLTMLGIAALLARGEIVAGANLLAAVAVKASAAIVLPFALLAAPKPRLFGGMGVAAVAIAGGALLAFGWSWLDAFALAGENQGRTSYMSVPITTARLTGLDAGPVRVAFGALFAGLVTYLLLWTARGNDWVRAAAWAAAALLLATAWLLPWYLIWALPLAALSRDRPLQLLLLGLTAYQLGARIPL